MNRTHAALTAGLMMIALTLIASAAMAQDDPADNMTAAYASLREQVKGENWEGVATEAQAIISAGEAIGQNALTVEQQYLVGMAHYYLMGIAMNAAISEEGLSAKRLGFAQELADSVYGREAPQKIVIVSHGERITLEDYLPAGKTTIVDFYSKYCPPCITLGPVLEGLVAARDDLTLVKVDINRPGQQGIDWGSPVAQQFALQSIPYLRVYGPDGAMLAEGRQALTMVLGWAQ